jgi:hypothetical protein
VIEYRTRHHLLPRAQHLDFSEVCRAVSVAIERASTPGRFLLFVGIPNAPDLGQCTQPGMECAYTTYLHTRQTVPVETDITIPTAGNRYRDTAHLLGSRKAGNRRHGQAKLELGSFNDSAE